MSNTAKKIDGIYLQVKTALSKPENKRRLTLGTAIVIIVAVIFSFSPSKVVHSGNNEDYTVISAADIPLSAKKPPNLSSDKILEIKGAVLNAVIVKIERDEKNELWLFNLDNGEQENIGSGTSVASNFPIGIKGDLVFWLSRDKNTLFGFDIGRKIRFYKPIPAFDPAQGERAKVKLREIPWEVIVGADNFYFFSKDTGEVFSDGNSEVLDLFRQKFKLDEFLSKEELNNIGYVVEEENETSE
ncbi:hypothetical protein A2V71_01405 [Candidatus Berkelbacteria bacterium RBG_13_40_8]|uniref:Uncharacterized protein n=1 Tax=Candidatus Berkelbacteria bacterium RBG_13_40_8 TaxID=1797467 RepID=A0A1F5DMR3_9BACT|nr:MAG: hypothetical protein A2V71_01405 [Candidatus Berkelbacteria bacterium RBG_13_40_8]